MCTPIDNDLFNSSGFSGSCLLFSQIAFSLHCGWLAPWRMFVATAKYFSASPGIVVQFVLQIYYSAFAKSCPLQTDTFLFPLIHSHNVLLSSIVQWKIGPITTMYGVPPRGQTRDNSNTSFFNTKKEHIDMCSYIIYVLYLKKYIYIYMSHHILFEGVCFVLSYPTHICRICRWIFF